MPPSEATKRYPVLVQVYGGPGGETVRKVWNTPSDQLYLEAGFILFALDNHGTPNRSVAFKTAIDRKLGTWEVADQLDGVRYLKSLPYVDPARIGVTGYSYGGYMTLMLMTAPDSPFAAGLAGAPPTDWAMMPKDLKPQVVTSPLPSRRTSPALPPPPPVPPTVALPP